MELFEAIKKRRSIRAFEPKPVPEELIDKILEAARWAPSAGNRQARDFIIVKDKDTKRMLSQAALDQDFIEEAPLDIVVCANGDRSARRYGERGMQLYSILDAAAAVQNLLLAVYALGLGACWVGAFRDGWVSEILNLPTWLRPIAIIPLGYPAERPRPTPRMPIEQLVHRERFKEQRFVRM